MTIDALRLSQATGSRLATAAVRLSIYEHAMSACAIDTRLRMACFLANVGVESGGFQYSTEIWGPTAAQDAYEGRRDLGNVRPGDGSLFRGHGDIQCTGRSMHAAMRDRLRRRYGAIVPDFEVLPTKLAEMPWAAYSAAEFWSMVDGNAYADAANFDACCDKVNRGHATIVPGDSGGFARRLELFVIAMRVLP